jgi:membrane associated rhomboid family serine protease
MILPFLSGIRWPKHAPITWLLVSLNIITFVTFSILHVDKKNFLEKIEGDAYFLRAQGHLFSQFIVNHAEHYPEYIQRMADMSLKGDTETQDLLGRLAFRDLRFIVNADQETFSGDQVQVNYWQEVFAEFKQYQNSSPNFQWGLSQQNDNTFYWFTYQFVHGGFFHLLGNVWFLIIFGGFLEPLIGSLTLLILYLASGVFGAAAFLLLSGAIAVPLVGASGAISGLMGLFVVISWKRPVRFMFWLLPFKGYSGFINLPAWVALTFWLVSDVKGYLGSLAEFGGIAHITHLGGLAIGIVSSFLITYRLRKKHLPLDQWIENKGVHLPELEKIKKRMAS